MIQRTYRLSPDEYDERDYMYTTIDRELPTSYDLRTTYHIDILDQGDYNTCVANEISNALRYCLVKEHSLDFQPSRCFIYYFARLLDGTPTTDDNGTTIRSGLKAIARYGAPKEELCPYDSKYITHQPSKIAMQAGSQHVKNFKYIRISNNLNLIKQAITEGYPIIVGIQVYSSFEDEKTIESGNISLPNINNEQMIGGHCVALYGYNDATRRFIMMNSWGTAIGQKGWFTIPYEYINNTALTFDLWTIRYFK